ncbi:hypothetical protein [Lacinutrix venerupis]|uniref:Uncharacterized protein n=1 Tax=Lacinutrix venerupis TaxID=1486034 RepID=A0AAC9LLI4_9FLAO|nr:hypothetical protein [Lacinutrix venerupis]APY00679.1 hypothetical protein BWR22_10260 [Lacinutrix venerupis]
MSIRIGNSCINCDNLLENENCKIHGVKVSTSYTCDSFEMKAALKNDPNCDTCARYQGPTCANPQKATPGMLCSHWAPQNATA